MADQAKDGRPDVKIRSFSQGDHNMRSGRVPITHEAACRWCPESCLSPDVRDVVKWADAHEQSLGHTYGKQERIADGVGPRDPWAVL